MAHYQVASKGTRHVAIGDRYILRSARITQREGALGANTIVPRRVHAAVRHADVAAAVDVHAIAIRVDLQVVDRQIVDPRSKDAEVPSFQNGEVTQDDVMAILQCDCPVPRTRLIGTRSIFVRKTAAQSVTPDQSRSKDGEIINAFAPDQTVVPMIMSIVLIGLPWLIWLGRIVATGGAVKRRACSKNRSSLLDVESDIALQPNGIAGIGPGRKANRAATSRRSSFNCLIDRRRIDGFAIANCP